MISAPVLDDLLTARLAAELCLQRKLDAFLSVVIHVGEADEMRSHFAAGIVAAIFALQRNAGNAQLDDLCRLLGRQLAFEIDEFARGIAELALHFCRAQSDDLCQLGNLRRGNFDIARARPDRFHRRADRQGFAIAVRDHAAMRMDFDDTSIARIAFLLQEIRYVCPADTPPEPAVKTRPASSSTNSTRERQAGKAIWPEVWMVAVA